MSSDEWIETEKRTWRKISFLAANYTTEIFIGEMVREGFIDKRYKRS